MKIKKSKQIRLQITGVASFGIIFSVALCYFLGWEFEVKSFLIAIGILFVLLSVIWLLCFALIKFEKKYYVVEKDRIVLFYKDKPICELKKNDIIEMHYVRLFWALLMQMGGGYLNISCPVEALTDRKYAALVMPDGKAIFEISLTKKQAKKIAELIGKSLKIQ